MRIVAIKQIQDVFIRHPVYLWLGESLTDIFHFTL